jgi:hypothetical protein
VQQLAHYMIANKGTIEMKTTRVQAIQMLLEAYDKRASAHRIGDYNESFDHEVSHYSRLLAACE